MGGEVWPEKSSKIQLPNRGGWRYSPASGGYREVPGSHFPFEILFSMPFLLYFSDNFGGY